MSISDEEISDEEVEGPIPAEFWEAARAAAPSAPRYHRSIAVALLAAYRARPAGEAVAWMVKRLTGDGSRWDWTFTRDGAPKWSDLAAEPDNCIPLYAAPPALTSEAVAIKPLEWQEHTDGGEWYSDDDPTGNALGLYWIKRSDINRGEFDLLVIGHRDDSYRTMDEAKAAAQADHEARIRYALHPARGG